MWRILRLRPVLDILQTKRISGGKGKIPGAKVPQKKRATGSVHLDSDARLTADPLALPVGLFGRTGVQPGFDSDCQDPWPADRPLVSVVIPCFNYSHFVAEAVQSVHGQTFRDLEVIVVEGGSSSLESRQELAEMELPRTRILLQPEAHRAGANRNFGISHARGKYICCLDADDRIDPTYVEKAVFLIEHYGYDVVSTAVEFFGNRSSGYNSIEAPTLERMLHANYVPTCALFKREFWVKAGGFRDSDLNTGHIHEDWLFWVRLGALGARFWNITGERLFKYRVHGVSLSSGQDVLSIEHQRAAIRDLNADVLKTDALERSEELAAQDWRHPDPLRNLDRLGRDVAHTRPAVLLALPFLIIGGAERLLSLIVSYLNAVGWRVVIVTTVRVEPEHGDTTEWFRSSTNEIYHFPRFLKQDRWNDFIDYLIRTKRISLLWIVGSAAFYERLPWLKTLYPDLKVLDLLFNTVGHTASNRKYANLIDLNLVENQEVRSWLIEQGEASGRIRLIESGLDLVSYSPKPKGQDVLHQLGVSSDTIIIGFSGRWSEEKDPLGFIEIAKLVPEGVPVTFIMTGAGPLRKKLEAAVADANFPAGRFHLMGAVSDVAPFIASYDLLCLPSRFDGRPVVVLEALALGVPVIASSVGALPEMIEQAVSGLLCDAGDYAAFAEYIVQLARDPNRLQQMKYEARLAAEQKFDARRMLADYEAALTGLLAKP
jgi:glycosyltransferase involved in cell wall biosynthesis